MVHLREVRVLVGEPRLHVSGRNPLRVRSTVAGPVVTHIGSTNSENAVRRYHPSPPYLPPFRGLWNAASSSMEPRAAPRGYESTTPFAAPRSRLGRRVPNERPRGARPAAPRRPAQRSRTTADAAACPCGGPWPTATRASGAGAATAARALERGRVAVHGEVADAESQPVSSASHAAGAEARHVRGRDGLQQHLHERVVHVRAGDRPHQRHRARPTLPLPPRAHVPRTGAPKGEGAPTSAPSERAVARPAGRARRRGSEAAGRIRCAGRAGAPVLKMPIVLPHQRTPSTDASRTHAPPRPSALPSNAYAYAYAFFLARPAAPPRATWPPPPRPLGWRRPWSRRSGTARTRPPRRRATALTCPARPAPPTPARRARRSGSTPARRGW